MHDIRAALPFTDQTNPAKFPQYEFRAFPKMLLDDGGKPILGPDKAAIVARDESEYNALRAKHYKAPVSVDVASTGVTNGAIAKLTNESEEIAKLRAELAALKAAPVAETAGKKRGRPAKAKIELPSDLD